MKKNLIIFAIILPAILILASCEKENIKNGDKKIVGTWILTSQTTTSHQFNKNSTTYTPKIGYYNDYYSSFVSDDSYNFDGTKMTNIYKYTSEYVNGDYGDTTKVDTTYVYEHSYEITFNEDGTYYTNIIYSETDNDITEKNNGEIKGTWTWIDCSTDKMAVKLNNYKILYIEEMDKKGMTVKIEISEETSNEVNSKEIGWDYLNNVEVILNRKQTYSYTYSETGEQIFIKKEETKK